MCSSDLRVLPAFERPDVAYVGEIGGAAKDAFLGGAFALLFPIDWPEPFGLVMIEAMACGTPVVGFNRASLPEIVRDGETGFLVEDVAAMAQAVGRVGELDPWACREHVLRHFSADVMVERYLGVYEQVISRFDPAT